MAPPRKIANDSSNKTFSTRILVNIKRDQTTATPVVIWAHEFAILEAIHGEGNVELGNVEKMDEGYSKKPSPDMLIHNKRQDPILPPSQSHGLGFVFAGDHQAEYDRLCMVYGRHPEVNMPMAEHVYGRFQAGNFSRAVNEPELSDMPVGQLRELVIAHGYLPLTDKDSTPEERKEAEAKRAALFAMDAAKLLPIAEELAGAYA